jgi:thioesterase domain-containing protein
MTGEVSTIGAPAPAAVTAAHCPVTPDGVRVELLRSGAGECLFIVPGLAGDPTELADLIAALSGPHHVYGLIPLLHDAQHQPIATVERIAEQMVAAIRDVAPSGPYRLAGYSFGALIALEMAQQLRAGGDSVEALFLIEAVYDERFWPRDIWLRALARRSGRQLGRIARMPPRAAISETRVRGARLMKRVVRRGDTTADVLHADAEDDAVGRAYRAIGRYRPRFYDGRITLIVSSADRHFGCDTAEIWAGHARQLDVARVPGDHLTVMHDPCSAAAVAKVIDHRLALSRPDWAGLTPVDGFERPMLLATMRWFSAARLGHALGEAGFTVSACRPKGHPLELVDALAVDSRLHRLWPLKSIERAIRRAEPDIILCDDERGLKLLRRLYQRASGTDPELSSLIAHSLGSVEQWPIMTSRTALAREVRAMSRPAPKTAVIDNPSALASWVAAEPYPIVLKTDGSWGGRGVAIVRDPSHLVRAWQKTSSPPDLLRALKRAVFDLDVDSLLARLGHEKPVVNAQQYLVGREAIVTLACLDGKVQSLVCLEVVEVSEPRGPATIVRVIENEAMAETARQLVCLLGLSGFCGFDFILTDDGQAHLVEVNPRVTPTCHLLVEAASLEDRVVTLFPPLYVPDLLPNGAPGGRRDTLDIPPRAQSLTDRGIRMAVRHNDRRSQIVRGLKRRARWSPSSTSGPTSAECAPRATSRGAA